MTNTDSFISEVSEEVRKDRLFALFRRYGWIGIVLVFLIVGAAVFNEWRNSQIRTTAENFGDGFLSAVSESDFDNKLQTLTELNSEGEQRILVSLAKAATMVEAGDEESALIELSAIANDETNPIHYRQLAELKSIWIESSDLSLDEMSNRLAPLEQLGSPYRLLASETMAHALVASNQFSEAVDKLNLILQEVAVPGDLRNRAQQLLNTLEMYDESSATSN